MFHAAVFVMMSRRLSDQSEMDHHEMPSQNCRAGGPRQGGADPPERWTMSRGGKPAKPVPNPRRETLSLDGKSPVGAGDSTPTGV
jgi:hypothetical protein